MASNVVRVAVVGDSSQLRAAFGEGATAAEKFRARIDLVGKAIVAAMAVKALGAVKDFVADSRRAYSELNESLNAVEVLYGSNAEAIKRMGRQAAESFGLSNSEFNSFAVSIFAFAKEIAGPGGDIVGVVQDMMTRVADFASIMNLDVNVAFEKFQSGLAGQSRPLREFGIDVSDARVQVFALENGIGEVGREMTQGEKVVARYGLIMEQTDAMAGDFQNTIEELENATRVTNSQLENSKAVLGEALLPVWQETNKAQRAAVGIITEIVSEYSMLTGEMTKGAAAVAEHEAKTSDYIDTAKEAIDVSARYAVRLSEIVEAADLSVDELRKLRDMDREVLLGMGHTEEQIEDLNNVLGVKFAEHNRNAAKAVMEWVAANEEGTESLEDQEAAILDVVDAHRAATDPVANAIRAGRELKDAQNAYNDALRKHGEPSQEAEAAALDLLEAQNDLNGSLREIATKGGPGWREEFKRVARQSGLAEESIDNLIAAVERADGMSSTVNVIATVTAPNFRYIQGSDGTARPRHTGTSVFQHGGIVTGPTLAEIGEAGDKESVIPLNAEGARFMAATMIEALKQMNGGGTGVTLNIYAPVLTEHDIVDFVERGLQAKARRNGSLGL